jgi:hypothetical protein
MMIKTVCKVASREARFLGCSIGLTISGCWLTKGCCSATGFAISLSLQPPSRVVETTAEEAQFADDCWFCSHLLYCQFQFV